MKPLNPTIHTHHWVIDRHQNGICECGAEREFPLLMTTWVKRLEAEHKERVAATERKKDNALNVETTTA